jgi:cysteine-rich repeat protein
MAPATSLLLWLALATLAAAIPVCYRTSEGLYQDQDQPRLDIADWLKANVGSCMDACPCDTYIETCFQHALSCIDGYTHIEAFACTSGIVLHYGWSSSDTHYVGGDGMVTYSHTMQSLGNGTDRLIAVGPRNVYGAPVVRPVPGCISAAYDGCLAGWADCNGIELDGCETLVAFATADCGICGNACVAGEACSNNVCTPVCGNGIITPPETCDDGNAIGGDGCSGICHIEV